MSDSLSGKVALVTGGSSGIGRAAALAFARAGAAVVIGDIAEEGSVETVRLVKEAGGEALFVPTDVAQAAAVEALVAAAVAQYGRLDCAFNNAGVEGPQASTANYPLDKWHQVININLTGVWLCMKYEIPQMLKGGGGVIVNNASVLGTLAFPGASAYVASKHAVLGLTKTAALEYATRNIRVNAVCPGFIDTPMVERPGIKSDPNRYQFVTGLHPMKRLGQPEEIAAVALWLCSDAASFITGQAILSDGGYAVQ